MFVGEVRRKISRLGVSWTLSGGSQEVCGPTKSSKYLQVRRAAVRKNRRSFAVNVPPRQLFAGRSITITATGKSADKRRNGPTATIAVGPRQATAAKRSTQAAGIQSQPARRRATVAGGTRLRRKLSKIFHRLKAESGLGSTLPAPTGTRGFSQSMICQSPRIQRCCLFHHAM